MRVVCIYPQNENDLRFLAETCMQFSPQIALAQRWLFIEIGACRNLYSEEHFLKALQEIFSEFKIAARVEIAGDLPSAIAAIVFNVHHKELLPIEAIPYFFNPFRVEAQFDKMVEVFRHLGITNFKKLSHIPQGLLAAKFNKDLSLVLRQINDAKNILWPRFVPEEKITESHDFEETQSISNTEPLIFVLRGLLARAISRLHGREMLMSKFEIVMEQEKYSTVKEASRSQIIEMAFPHNSAPGLCDIIRDRLEKELSLRPLESNVTKITLRILEQAPGGYRQKDFFTHKEEDREALQSLISRVKDKLGDNRIFYAQPLESFFPEKSWAKTLTEPTAVPVNIAPRPLRVLKNPVKLGRVENYFICRQRRWKATSISEPERLSGDWWIKEEGRRYYTIRTESGEELWVYSPDNSEDYFLHGIYD